jgi:hypothetical protein
VRTGLPDAARSGSVLVARLSLPFRGRPLRGEVSSADAFWLTVSEAARFAGVRPGVWLALVQAGRVPPAEDVVGVRWRLETMRVLGYGALRGVTVDAVEDDPGRLLTAKQVAHRLGILPTTWNAYVCRGQAPAADVPDLESPVNRRRPLWRVATVEEYRRNKKRRAWKLPAK